MAETIFDGLWHIGWFYPIEDNPETDKGIAIREAISDEEHGEIKQHLALVTEWTSHHPLNTLRDSVQALDDALYDWHDDRRPGDSTAGVQRAMGNWLSDFRAFVDQITTRLTRRFGENSDELLAFTSATNDEFDASFPYRFTCKLRNYAQHVSSPIQHVGSRETEEGIEVHAEFNAARLLADYDAWGQRLRADLEAIGGQFPVMPTVDSVMDSCERIAAKTIVGIRGALEPAADAIESFLAKYPGSDEAAQPLLIRMPGPEQRRDQITYAAIYRSWPQLVRTLIGHGEALSR